VSDEALDWIYQKIHTPRTETSMCPPRIMEKDSELSNVEAPGTKVTVSLPALTISASTSSAVGYGP
jgi:hypothetical protein